MANKKVVLAAVNARYIHSNLAVYSLKANAGEYAPQVILCEYTINHRREEILADLYEQKADIIGFSCYLWNVEYVISIARDLKKICPGLEIVVGGPEGSYHPEQFLSEYNFFDMVIVGEGEQTFSEFLDYAIGGNGSLADICGIVYRDGDKVRRNAPSEGINIEKLIFPYEDLSNM